MVLRRTAWLRAAVIGSLALGLATSALAQDEGASSGDAAESSSSRGSRRARARRRAGGSVADRILVHDGRAMQRFGRGAVGSSSYADAINTIAGAVGDRATVYSIIVPTAQEFYCPDPPPPGRTSERPSILATYALLAPGIRRVDAHAELAQHTDENLYFRTDVHWTGLAGYYAYRAFAREAGFEPVPLERMEHRVLNEAWLGSLHRMTRDPSLRPDVVEIYVPPAQVELRAAARVGGGEREASLFRPGARGYAVFLGGDHPIMHGRTTTHSGRRVILVKNSYGNAFAVQLVSHYEEVVFIDYRTFRGSLMDVLAESELPTDLVFMNASLTASSPRASRMILELLHGRGHTEG